MDLKKLFQSKPAWLKGGIKGSIICVILFLFYLLIYFPVINNIYAEDIAIYGGTPAWTTAIPLFTGHLFPLFSGFVVPYGFFCKSTEPICTQWVIEDIAAEEGLDCVPWIDGEGGAGCCIEQSTAPTDTCAKISDGVGFAGLMILLMGIYFVIGAIIGRIIHQKS
ncbi:MAG: hypothetical protein Q8R47_03845 [Nanoarchaeota archaeon]|nr:hypothetical protein [Nanoarchaeota archaeon]